MEEKCLWSRELLRCYLDRGREYNTIAPNVSSVWKFLAFLANAPGVTGPNGKREGRLCPSVYEHSKAPVFHGNEPLVTLTLDTALWSAFGGHLRKTITKELCVLA